MLNVWKLPSCQAVPNPLEWDNIHDLSEWVTIGLKLILALNVFFSFIW